MPYTEATIMEIQRISSAMFGEYVVRYNYSLYLILRLPRDEGKLVKISNKYTNKQSQGNKATVLKLAVGIGKIVTISDKDYT